MLAAFLRGRDALKRVTCVYRATLCDYLGIFVLDSLAAGRDTSSDGPDGRCDQIAGIQPIREVGHMGPLLVCALPIGSHQSR